MAGNGEKNINIRFVVGSLIALLAVAPSLGETPLGTGFTYHGQLKEGGAPFEGAADFQFTLWDAAGIGNPPKGGTQVGGVQAINALPVTAGLFTVTLNAGGEFGASAFLGEQRWLEISVNGTPLSPRQELTAVPYALHSAGPWVTNGQDISYVRGAVGVGTSTPVHPFDVAGDTKLRERLAVGNDAGFGINSPYGYADFDVSHIHSDFAASVNWSAFRSYITFDPNIDLPHPSSLYSHDFECVTPATNDHSYDYLQGPYLGAFHRGGGHVGILAGGNIVAQTTGTGSVDFQIGGYIASYLGTGGEGTGTIQRNEGLEIITGNAGAAGGTVINDYSMYVFSPNHAQPMTNHYGIYLEDQDFGVNDSYAIYSAGGKNYLAGNLGIGTSAPQARLHVGGVAGQDGIMFPDGTLQTSAAIGGGGDSIWSLSGVNAYYNAGKVGVGTSIPDGKLHVAGGPTWTSNGWLKSLAVNNAAAIELGNGAGPTRFGIGSSSNGLYFFRTSTEAAADSAHYFMSADSAGRIAMGDLAGTLTAKLDIFASGDGAELLRLSTERPWVFRQVYSGSGAALQLRSTVGLKNFEITAAGGANVATFFASDLAGNLGSKVGIGTTTPASKLDIAATGEGAELLRFSTERPWVFRQIRTGPSAGLELLSTTGQKAFAITAVGGENVATFMADGANSRVGIGTPTGPALTTRLDVIGYTGDAVHAMHVGTSGTAAVNGASLTFDGNGVIGQADVGNNAFGVWGRSASGIGGYFTGGTYALIADGRARVDILEIAGADVAEKFLSSDDHVAPGTVMEIDPDNPGKLRMAREAYSSRVAGVVSGAGDIPVGAILGNLPGHEDAPPVALSGRVWVRCDASSTAIAPGDMLTTSDTPGHAMKAADRARAYGTILGKSMTALAQGERGLVLVLVNLQ